MSLSNGGDPATTTETCWRGIISYPIAGVRIEFLTLAVFSRSLPFLPRYRGRSTSKARANRGHRGIAHGEDMPLPRRISVRLWQWRPGLGQCQSRHVLRCLREAIFARDYRFLRGDSATWAHAGLSL